MIASASYGKNDSSNDIYSIYYGYQFRTKRNNTFWTMGFLMLKRELSDRYDEYTIPSFGWDYRF